MAQAEGKLTQGNIARCFPFTSSQGGSALPRYFFNVEGNPFYPEDDEGVVLPGMKEARSQAVIAAGELLKDADGEFWDKPEWRM